ncbi:GNAT family N-acetyltransferase [Jannaschia sp. M317]|uniref:GNAT family N-acetyltransferase n=1 Tax=Jannaschia sp. M317 TaxID=2867011 RepID=UPI0021A552BB|nr:GNAT family N-acetyltransferase [Jannaschia sp. M317]UWQ18479.1 GNAT family N-acetyltransferase [Jannaschia sp. M317]
MVEKIDVTLCSDLPDQGALNEILKDYYRLAVARMQAMGIDVDPAAPTSALAEFWQNATDYLSPRGCLAIARTDAGELVGCGMMKRLDSETGEMKRLYVSDRVRGTGAGRRLVDIRVEEARRMGLRRLVADTLTSNVEMRGLYPKLGFANVPGPIETSTYRDQPMLRPHLHYFVRELEPSTRGTPE